ncbi:hypothetical protein KIPB_001311 [Kipferlia bialata]|uniref:Nudix hydrolase domain-containing protein n=1 Tax=Kipferlia bialata TaxID=797122 RepID=A0A9K3GF37_9EUKA|nr:hypothetical protein KIPB_001311 [Kipferlia bialata]|eukprot:g1311.t1
MTVPVHFSESKHERIFPEPTSASDVDAQLIHPSAVFIRYNALARTFMSNRPLGDASHASLADFQVGREDAGVVIEKEAGEREGHRMASMAWLGVHSGRPVFVVIEETEREEQDTLLGVRGIFNIMPADEEATIMGHALVVAQFRLCHKFCSKCGSPSSPSLTGAHVACGACKHSQFPPTYPCVIMLVTCKDRAAGTDHALLIERRSLVHTHIAGFIDVVETPISAAVREVKEESGVDISAISGRGVRVLHDLIQPWPFSSSLMIPYHLCCDEIYSAPPATDPCLTEVLGALWLSKSDMALCLKGEGEYHMPGANSVARRMMEMWVAGDL